MTGGYIRLHRSLLGSSIAAATPANPFCELGAFAFLLMEAAFKEHRDRFGRTQRRGEVLTSQRALAERWGWDRKSVVRFLNRLQAEGTVTLQMDPNRVTGGTRILFVNYDLYQAPLAEHSDTADAPTPRTTDSIGKYRKNGTAQRAAANSEVSENAPQQKNIRTEEKEEKHIPALRDGDYEQNSVSIAKVSEAEPRTVSIADSEFALDAEKPIPIPEAKNIAPQAPAAQASPVPAETQKPKKTGNVWSWWIDMHREFKLIDPAPIPADTSASREIGKLDLPEAEVRAVLRMFRRDEDRWLKNQGYPLRHLPGRINAYREKYAKGIREQQAEKEAAEKAAAEHTAREEKLASMTPEERQIHEARGLLMVWWLEQISAGKGPMNKTLWEDCRKDPAILLSRFGPQGDLKKQIRQSA